MIRIFLLGKASRLLLNCVDEWRRNRWYARLVPSIFCLSNSLTINGHGWLQILSNASISILYRLTIDLIDKPAASKLAVRHLRLQSELIHAFIPVDSEASMNPSRGSLTMASLQGTRGLNIGFIFGRLIGVLGWGVVGAWRAQQLTGRVSQHGAV